MYKKQINWGGGNGLEKPHVDIVIVGNEKVPNYVKGIKGEMFNCEFDENGKMSRIITPQADDEIRYTSTDGQVIWPYKFIETTIEGVNPPTIIDNQDGTYSMYSEECEMIYGGEGFVKDGETISYYLGDYGTYSLNSFYCYTYDYNDDYMKPYSKECYKISNIGEDVLVDGKFAYRWEVYDLVNNRIHGYIVVKGNEVVIDDGWLKSYALEGKTLYVYDKDMNIISDETLMPEHISDGYIPLISTRYEEQGEPSVFFQQPEIIMINNNQTVQKSQDLAIGEGSDYFGADILSNTYVNGEGVIKFSGNITKMMGIDDTHDNPWFLFHNNKHLKTIQMPNLPTLSYDEGSDMDSGFQGCSNLQSVKLSENTTTLHWAMFNGCTALTNITIPRNVNYIMGCCFQGCENLSTVTCNPIVPPMMDSYCETFDNTSPNLVIKVPSESVNAYKTAEGWEEYADRIQAI